MQDFSLRTILEIADPYAGTFRKQSLRFGDQVLRILAFHARPVLTDVTVAAISEKHLVGPVARTGHAFGFVETVRIQLRKVHAGQTASELFGPEMPPVAVETHFEISVVDFPLNFFLVSAQLQCLRNIDLLAVQQFYYLGDQIQQADAAQDEIARSSEMQGQRSDVVTARINQAFERLSLFERRDVFPLQVFGNGEVFRFGIAHRADLSPYGLPSRQSGRTKTPFAAYERVAFLPVAAGTERNGMDQPDPGHVVGQFPKTLFGKVPAGIEIVRNDRIQRDLLLGQVGGGLRERRARILFRTDLAGCPGFLVLYGIPSYRNGCIGFHKHCF